ncbi:MAG: 4-(cytidine 5'-diphospho)-2-C-methyl-D-erythritol kinase [Vampirovibrionales bacterium]
MPSSVVGGALSYSSYTHQSVAKLNLSLRLLRPRNDGYTELHSVVARLSIGDTLTLTPLPAVPIEATSSSQANGELHFSTNAVGLTDSPEQNLAVKAYRLFASTQPKPLPPVALHLEKALPVQAGLGGGSSNAASTLLLLNHWVQQVLVGEGYLPLSTHQLHQLAAQLGSDVNLFIEDRSPLMLMSGRGERVEPLPLSVAEQVLAPWQIVIVKHHAVAVSTIEAYQWIHQSKAYSADAGEQQQLALFDALHQHAPLHDHLALLINDFAPVVYKALPELGNMDTRLRQLGASHTLLCGSGACVAGVFTAEAYQRFQANKAVAKHFPQETHTLYPARFLTEAMLPIETL